MTTRTRPTTVVRYVILLTVLTTTIVLSSRRHGTRDVRVWPLESPVVETDARNARHGLVTTHDDRRFSLFSAGPGGPTTSDRVSTDCQSGRAHDERRRSPPIPPLGVSRDRLLSVKKKRVLKTSLSSRVRHVKIARVYSRRDVASTGIKLDDDPRDRRTTRIRV